MLDTTIINMQTPTWTSMNWMWKLEDGRIWSTKEAKFVDEGVAQEWLSKHPNMTEIPASPVDQNQQHSLEGLREAIVFYKLDLGELRTTEEKFEDLRKARDKKLEATDKYVLADFPIGDEEKQSVLEYRELLRKLPEQEGAPWDGGRELTPWPLLPEFMKN